MHTQKLTDLEAMLEGEIACTAIHYEPFLCTVEVVAICWIECGGQKHICEGTVNYIEHFRGSLFTCRRCQRKVDNCWHYRLI